MPPTAVNTRNEEDESFRDISNQLADLRFQGSPKNNPDSRTDSYFTHVQRRLSANSADLDQTWSSSSTAGSDRSTRKLLPPFAKDSMVVHQRESSLPSNSIAPLSIQKPRWRESPLSLGAAKTQRWPQGPNSPKEKARKLADFTARKSSVGTVLPKTPERSAGLVKSFNVESPPEPLTPSSVKTPHFGFNDSETNEDHSIASLNSPPSLSHSLRLSDNDSMRRLEKMRQKHYCIRELYNTEWQFAQDMAVVVRIYMCGSASLGLSVRQIDQLFSNVSQVLDISLSVVAILESHIPPQILHGDGNLGALDIAADKELRVGRAMCLALSGQLYEVYESYIHRSKSQTDTYYAITSPFHRHPQQANYQQTHSVPKSSVGEAKLAQWLDQCKRRASKFTTAWSLDSLLIKPVQRLGKYPLFLKTILDGTDEAHGDFEDSERAYKRSKHFLDCVNARFGLEDHDE